MTPQLMSCGHTANAQNAATGEPCCAICLGIRPGADTPMPLPSLVERQAQCTCKVLRPSSLDLPFFQYCGVGSPEALDICRLCHYHKVAHTPEAMARNKSLKCTTFVPHGSWEFDRFYCGHAGWD